jgi:uncharacterized protein (DUF433 family)
MKNEQKHRSFFRAIQLGSGIVSNVTEPIQTVPGFQWIVADPDLLGGQPAVKGTRLSVSHILACLSEGMTGEDIARDYPGFPPESVSEVLRFAAEKLEARGSGDDAAA